MRVDADMSPTLRHVLDDTEARLFVGRAREMERLAELLRAARRRPAVVYVHGPSGIGKSALLRAFRRHAATGGVPTVYVDASTLEPTPEALLLELSRRLSGDGVADVATHPHHVVGAIQHAVGQGELLLLVDGYDAVVGRDGWLRRDVFQPLGGGVCLVLAGRRHPADLWPDDPSWLATLVHLDLGPLTEDEARQLLQRMGLVHPPGLRHCVAVADGRPALLGLAVVVWLQRLRHIEDPTFGTLAEDRHRMDAAVLERFVHPNSRRLAWRAGVGNSDVDRLVAAACILRSFDRQSLAAIVGPQAVTTAWAQLQALPIVEAVQGGARYVVVPGTREALAGVVRRQRPWAERLWRRRAFEYHVQRVAQGTSRPLDAWPEMMHLVRGERDDPGGAEGLDGRPEGPLGAGIWRRGVSAAELADLEAGWGRAAQAAGLTVGEPALAALSRLLRSCPDAVLQARDPSGHLLGFGLLAPLDSAAAQALTALPFPVAAPSRGARDGVHLVLQLALAEPDPGLSLALRAALCDGLCAPEPASEVAAALPGPARLGLRPLAPGAAPTGPGILETHTLSLAFPDFLEWLRALMQVPPEQLPPASERLATARDALQVLHDERRLAATALGRFYAAEGRLPPGTSLRTLILDALASADLDVSGFSGRDILTLYYVERVGTHEAVAERLSLPRTTYFRYHREALARLGDALFQL
jgi:hypothetical protein